MQNDALASAHDGSFDPQLYFGEFDLSGLDVREITEWAERAVGWVQPILLKRFSGVLR